MRAQLPRFAFSRVFGEKRVGAALFSEDRLNE